MSTLTEQVSDLGREAADTLNHARKETADSLHAAASSIRRGGQTIESLADSTAKKLDGAGSFVRKHDLKRTIGDSRQIVRRYPVESLVLAAGVGLLTGFAMRRLTHVCDKAPARAGGA